MQKIHNQFNFLFALDKKFQLFLHTQSVVYFSFSKKLMKLNLDLLLLFNLFRSISKWMTWYLLKLIFEASHHAYDCFLGFWIKTWWEIQRNVTLPEMPIETYIIVKKFSLFDGWWQPTSWKTMDQKIFSHIYIFFTIFNQKYIKIWQPKL